MSGDVGDDFFSSCLTCFTHIQENNHIKNEEFIFSPGVIASPSRAQSTRASAPSTTRLGLDMVLRQKPHKVLEPNLTPGNSHRGNLWKNVEICQVSEVSDIYTIFGKIIPRFNFHLQHGIPEVADLVWLAAKPHDVIPKPWFVQQCPTCVKSV